MALFTEASSSSAHERVPSGFFAEDLDQGSHAYTSSAGLQSAASIFQDDEDIEPDFRPLTLPSGCWTLLPAIEACDNTRLPRGPFSAQHSERQRIHAERDALGHGESSINQEEQEEEVLVPFFVKESDKQPIGFLRPSIVEMLELDNSNAVTKMKSQPCWKILKTSQGEYAWAVAFEDWINQSENPSELRSEHMDRLARGWKQEGRFPEELKGWRNELYAVYGPPLSQDDANYTPLPGSNTALNIERAACSLFGFATWGVHLTAYVITSDNKYLIWTPRRSKTKQTWPGYLDNSVAGGITAGDSPLESVMRECVEEASLPPTFVRRRIRAAGTVSYVYKNKKGWLQPETQYIYELQMPDPAQAKKPSDGDATSDGAPAVNENGEPIVLRPNDGEAEDFLLMPVEEVLERIVKEEFKPNCALVLLDFFVRHGLLTAETDARFLEICERLHSGISPLPGPA